MIQRLMHILPIAACVSFLVLCTEPLPTQNKADELLKLSVSNIEINYDLDSGSVNCTWTPPDEPVSFYRLYRAVLSTTGEQSALLTDGPRSRIPGNANSFSDVVGLDNAEYIYSIRAVQIRNIDSVVTDDGVFYDTSLVEGPGSPLDTCWVGTGISFSINDGALFTKYDTCRLYVRDRNSVLARVDFSADSSFSNPVTRTLDASRVVTTVPWTLPQGPGTKQAWAKLHYHDGTDTIISDDIDIEPYKVEIKLRNEVKRPNETMRAFYARDGKGEFLISQRTKVDQYLLYRPFVEFGVSIFGDSTFERSFSYWLIFPDQKAVVPARGKWIHTMVKQDSLIALGAGHDDFHKYGYSFDPDSQPGIHNLSTLFFQKIGYGNEIEPEELALSPQEAYDTLTGMPYDQIRNFGKKEFMIAAVFTGRYFGETRVVISSGRVSTDVGYTSYYDRYQPYCLRDGFEFEFPEDGATIDGAFSINLNEDGTIYDTVGSVIGYRGLVWDKGGADVASIQLVIAEMPDQMANEWQPGITSSTITLDSILGFRHRVFDFDIGVRKDSKIFPVYWNDIDPTDWNSGYYLVAIVTEDSFGNRGIAPFEHMALLGYNTNPQHWRIMSGQMGL